MGICKCPGCKSTLIDAELYYRIGKIHGRKTKIKCPGCGKVTLLGKMSWPPWSDGK